MKNLFSLKSLFDINKYSDFQTLSKEIFIRVLIIIGLPILFFFGIQDLYQSNYVISGIVFVLISILFFLLFELNRKPEDSRIFLSKEIVIRLFLIIFVFYLLYIIGFEKSLSKTPWFLIFPVLIFSITDIKEALVWVFCVLLILIPILFYVNLDSSFDEILNLKIRFLIIFVVLTCVTLITNTIIRLAIQNLIDSKKKIQDTNIRFNNEIKDHKRTEKALQKNEVKFRNLVEISSDWIWEVNAQGIYTYSSPLVEAILGYKPEEIIGKTPFDLMPSQEAVKNATVLKNYIKKGESITGLENVNLHKDGRLIILETSAVPVFDEAGLLICYRGVDRDITARKQVEEEREKLITELQAALENIKTLNGLLPICSKCKKIRDDKGYWNNLEAYIQKHSNALFTHSMCQECSDELYGNEDWYIEMKKNKKEK